MTKAGGQTIIELWKNGEVVEDKNQVIEVDDSTASPTVSTDVDSSTNDGTEIESAIPNDGDEKSIKQEASSLLLDKLRTAIRSGDKTVLFTINVENTKGQRSRRPKFKNTRDDTLSAIQTLREETEKRNKNFLMSVFSRVNGNSNSRRRRHSNHLIYRNRIISNR